MGNTSLIGWTFRDIVARPYDPDWRRTEFSGDDWESVPVEVPPSSGLMLSWNAPTPNWAGCAFRISVRHDGEWTGWVPMGEWGQVFPVHQPEFPVTRSVDAACWDGVVDAVRVRVIRTPNHLDELPDIRRVVVALTAIDADYNAEYDSISDESQFVQNIPFKSQMDESERIRKRICGPTSLAMILARTDQALKTQSIATLAYDSVHDLYGNWSHLSGAAGEMNHVAWVQRLGCLHEVEERLQAGYHAILSVAYERGELEGSPMPRTDGHLLVLRGRTADGDPICNDPAFEDSRGDGIVYQRDQLERAWADHGGVTILLRPE